MKAILNLIIGAVTASFWKDGAAAIANEVKKFIDWYERRKKRKQHVEKLENSEDAKVAGDIFDDMP